LCFAIKKEGGSSPSYEQKQNKSEAEHLILDYIKCVFVWSFWGIVLNIKLDSSSNVHACLTRMFYF